MLKNLIHYLSFRRCVAISILVILIWATSIIFGINAYDVHSDITNVPEREYALVLGTGKFLKNGNINQYYKSRIKASAELYKAKKVKKLILSGDNSRKDYNEPLMMKEDLITRGVPDQHIILDYAGFRTLDSIRRCKNVFKCQSPIIVTQYYHAKRALFLCEENGMSNATAYEAKIETVCFRYKLRNNSREILAWLKAWIDINITNKKAKFEN